MLFNLTFPFAIKLFGIFILENLNAVFTKMQSHLIETLSFLWNWLKAIEAARQIVKQWVDGWVCGLI